jgi:hypothetical protein
MGARRAVGAFLIPMVFLALKHPWHSWHPRHPWHSWHPWPLSFFAHLDPLGIPP